MKDYYGWRARIGLIYPTEAMVMEPEFNAMAPEGVSIHTARVDLADNTIQGLEAMMDDDRIEVAAGMLGGRAPTSVVTFGGTSATFMRGIGYDQAVIKRMETVMAGVPASTTSTAVLRALKAIGARRVSFVGPYVDDVTARGGAFLDANGFEVTGAHGMGVSDNLELNDIPLERVYAYTKAVAEADADTIFISCTGLRTIGAIEALEQDLGRPVVSSVQATMWDALCIARVHAVEPGFGSLFDHWV